MFRFFSLTFRQLLRQFCWCVGFLIFLMPSVGLAAANIPFSIALSEPVTVTGTPRLVLNVGGVTRYATYASGSGTATLTFTYATQAGDVDLDGIAMSSPIDLNGGSITDLAGNALPTLTFTVPNTTGIKVNYPSVAMDFINNDYILSGTHYSTLPSFLTAAGGSFARASAATYYDASGALQTASAGTPRFDYDPITHAAKGILIEESRTNSVLWSEEFDNAAIVKNKVTITANAALAPNNTLTADLVVPTTALANYKSAQQPTPSLVTGTTYVVSLYAKAAGYSYVSIVVDGNNGRATYDLTTGASTSYAVAVPSSTYIGNGWWRLYFRFTAANSGVRNVWFGGVPTYADPYVSYTCDGTSGVYFWGGQFEEGYFPTTYIQTTTSTTTRVADSLTLPVGAWFNTSAGSAVTQSNSIGVGPAKWPGLFDFYLSGSERFGLYYGVSGNSMVAEQRSSSTSRVASRSASFRGIELKAAVAFDATGPHLSTNGSGAAGASAGGFPPSVSTLRLGWFDDRLNGTLSSFRYYPARVADTQLQLLTQ